MFTKKSIMMMSLFCSLAMASCQKTYTCQCSPSPIASEITEHEIIAVHKVEANRKCQALTPEVGIGGAPVCRLK
jgi:hypothetical protein